MNHYLVLHCFRSTGKQLLLAMATAARVSGLHALDSSGMTHTEDCNSIIIRSLPEFVAKNQSVTLGPCGHRHYTIRTLHRSVDHPYCLLCPICALRFYQEAMDPNRRHRK